jgi:alanine racemase
MNPPSEILISAGAYRHNLAWLRRELGPNVGLVSVVKANAYGHGIDVMVPLAERLGVRDFAVFSADEARAVRVASDGESRVTIMGYVADEDLDWTVAEGVAFYVFDRERLAAARAAAGRVSRAARIHLQIETGMNRVGLDQDALAEAASAIAGAGGRLDVAGVCTHLAGAESVGNYLRIQEQLRRFHERCAFLIDRGLSLGRRHVASSAAALIMPEARLDLVRVGISQYGYWPSQETRMRFMLERTSGEGRRFRDPLMRVMTWRSRIMSLKQVAPGDFVGYGISYQATRRQLIAAVPVGYYHGFARSLSNRGHVLVRGRRAAVLGTVNMNMMMVDVSDCPGVARGDEVVLIGRQGKKQISVGSFGDLSGLLNYEILARIPRDLPRRVIEPATAA